MRRSNANQSGVGFLDISGIGKPLNFRGNALPVVEKPKPKPKPVSKASLPKRVSSPVKAAPVKLPVVIKPKSTIVSLPRKSIREEAIELLQQPANGQCGKIRIKFNHYNKEFPIHNGVLKWTDVDIEYAFSFVYKGDYTRDLTLIPSVDSHTHSNLIPLDDRFHKYIPAADPDDQPYDNRQNCARDEKGDYFISIMIGQEFRVCVVEDPILGIGAEGLRIYDSPIKLTSEDKNPCLVSGNRAVGLISRELRALDVEKLSSDEAKDLLEKRDLEDILFSSKT